MVALTNDIKVQLFFDYLDSNSNLKSLATNADNVKVPIHRWFPFLAGFSHKFVEETLSFFSIDGDNCTIFDPFMGSGTTGVVARDFGVNVVGNESNFFLHNICNIKIKSNIVPKKIVNYSTTVVENAKSTWLSTSVADENPTILKCYSETNLKKLVALRNSLSLDSNIPTKYKDYIFLAINMTLPKSSDFKINVPYVSWNSKQNANEVFSQFQDCIQIICSDLDKRKKRTKSNINLHLHDSRKVNKKIGNNSIDMIFTSPPYLNNLDYGETLKIFLYFWKTTENWSQITDQIRKKAVVSSTTYYSGKGLSIDSKEDFFGIDFINKMPTIADDIYIKMVNISEQKSKRSSKKSFDVMTGLYFKDMHLVIEEMYRVLKDGALAFIVVGDSAPYGIHVPTDTLLGEIALKTGFLSYTLKPLRARGTKWKSLQFRHSLELRESLLILRK